MAAFESHLEETQGQIERLEQVFESLDEKVRGKHCDGIAGIIEEGKSIMEEDFDETTMDACLIAAGQRAEHYEMAAYGTLVAWAQAMGHTEAAKLLQQTLDEEKAADKKLSGLAEGGINRRRPMPRILKRTGTGRRRRPAVREGAQRRPVAGNQGRSMSKPFAIVTGASSGIGLELAAICAQEGFDLLVAADRPEIRGGRERFRGLGAEVTVVETDLATTAGVDGCGRRRRAGRSTRCSPTRAMGWAGRFSIRTSTRSVT